MKKDNIMDYYLGNKAYNLFLLGIIYNNPIYSEYILDKKNINATKIGCISNIFLAIKEDLVSKDKEGYSSRILIIGFENKYKDEYDFKWNINKINDNSVEDLSRFILNIIPQNITYNEEVMVILKEYASKMNNNYNKFNVIAENLTNLVLLDAIKENNTVNSNILFDKIKEKYNNIYISYNTLISSSIAMFNSLFSYANDDVYKNDNKYTLLDNNGLDYSKLDLSLINVQIKTIDNTIINELNIRKTAKEKELNLIDTKINKELNNLNIVKGKSNTNAINNITSKLNNLYNEKNTLTIVYNNIINELNICNNYYNNNLLYLENESIIIGIRNSIAHGNYEVVQCNNINDTYIVFNDIYEGELTFKGTIKILDFIDLIDNNAIVINEFLNNLDNKKYQITKTI